MRNVIGTDANVAQITQAIQYVAWMMEASEGNPWPRNI